MRLSFSTSLLAFYAVGIQQALAAPALDDLDGIETGMEALNITKSLVARAAGDTQNNPILADLTVTGQSQLPFDADCYAILCLGAPDVFQRVDHKQDTINRRRAGTCRSPFKKNRQKLTLPAPYPTWGNGQHFDSPEEFPFASTSQGGPGAYLIPVNLASQSAQGGVLSTFLRKNNVKMFNPKSTDPNAADGTWYKIKNWKGDLGPYCTALMKSPPDTSVCKATSITAGDWGFDIGNFVYQLDSAGKTFKPVPKKP
ncbi:hypothetical protein ISF_02131 [Cordyceps fumosorosea ARSEF 2679]|uniref:Deoxyribonuclease NucA/NucB domain-containing protein n=1 Tax=Cordyceps fumosorosea (strain ARSEF 2679) TaxID=1081104 RepID=A0A168CN29_CORFA|nr:hypothetical protein ISF_02131 [Cordyceps fumosorosea ARSEF 2679]OAA71580.1 hypothetical protein ISF_02131 [Cordyceps fumosorosea ARSEF 2679]